MWNFRTKQKRQVSKKKAMRIKTKRRKEIPRAPSPSLWVALAAQITETSARWKGKETANSKDQSQKMAVSKRGATWARQAVQALAVGILTEMDCFGRKWRLEVMGTAQI